MSFLYSQATLPFIFLCLFEHLSSEKKECPISPENNIIISERHWCFALLFYYPLPFYWFS